MADLTNTKLGSGIVLAGGFDLQAKAPLDSRATVLNPTGLTELVNGNATYEGMIVYVESNGVTYQYVKKENATGEFEWKEFGFNQADFDSSFAAGIVNNLTSDATDKALSAAQGKALKGLIDQIDVSLGGLTGAMHFIGITTTDPKLEITIEGKPNYIPADGDVIIYGTAEYVYANNQWHELGDVSEEERRLDALENIINDTEDAEGNTVKGLASKVNDAVSDASTAKSDASTAKGNAQTALNTANEAKEAALTAQNSAKAYSESASASAAAAGNAKQAALDAQEAAEAAQAKAEEARDAAEDFKSAAAGSAEQSAASAGQAAGSATAAAGSAESAFDSAQSAEQSALRAEDAATTAAGHEENASNRATDAEYSATAAAASESNAASSASAASQAKTDALQAKTDAVTAKNAAETARDAAAGSASAAATSATNAGKAQTAAETAQGAAEAAKNQAEQFKIQTEDLCNEASMNQQAAYLSETKAAASAENAGKAQTAAEAAQAKATAAQGKAETAQRAAESAQAAASKSAEDAGKAKTSAESAQTKAEAAQAAAEAAAAEAVNANSSATAIAGEAKGKAEEALTKAEAAVTTANNANAYAHTHSNGVGTVATKDEGTYKVDLNLGMRMGNIDADGEQYDNKIMLYDATSKDVVATLDASNLINQSLNSGLGTSPNEYNGVDLFINLKLADIDGEPHIVIYDANDPAEVAIVASMPASDFIKDGMLHDVAYDAASNTLTFTWNTDAGEKTDTVVLSDIIDPYTAGAKIKIEGTTISHDAIAAPTATAGTGRTYLTSVTTDGYGHITGFTTASESDQDLSNYKTKQTAVANKITNKAHVLTALTQNDNGVIDYSVKELTPADIGAQPVGNYKTIQDAVVDPTASGKSLTFIDSISQDANGVITATKKDVNLDDYETVAGAAAKYEAIGAEDRAVARAAELDTVVLAETQKHVKDNYVSYSNNNQLMAGDDVIILVCGDASSWM